MRAEVAEFVSLLQKQSRSGSSILFAVSGDRRPERQDLPETIFLVGFGIFS